MVLRIALMSLLCVALGSEVRADEIKLLRRAADPYGAPWPAPGQKHVPLRTTFYFELGMSESDSQDAVLPESVVIELTPDGGKAFTVLGKGRMFADGFRGRFLPSKANGKGRAIAVYVEPKQPLRPDTAYTIRVVAKSRAGHSLPEKAGTWRFTTEVESKARPIEFKLAMGDPATLWEGGFFTGFCNVSFCTSHALRVPTYELMAAVRKTAPQAWSLQRDFWMTGMEYQPGLLARNLPNIVRERETRHITAMDKHADGHVLHVEDFFGHGQYGIPANRPLSGDYHAGDEVLISDGINSSRAKVVKVDDKAGTVLVSGVVTPKSGWKLDYAKPLPKKEDPNAPGLFPPGGCHLIKFSPHGTPAYYWGRLDREWDLAHKRFGRRVMPNFADAPGDLSQDGRSWTTAKDYAELHEVTAQLRVTSSIDMEMRP